MRSWLTLPHPSSLRLGPVADLCDSAMRNVLFAMIFAAGAWYAFVHVSEDLHTWLQWINL